MLCFVCIYCNIDVGMFESEAIFQFAMCLCVSVRAEFETAQIVLKTHSWNAILIKFRTYTVLLSITNSVWKSNKCQHIGNDTRRPLSLSLTLNNTDFIIIIKHSRSQVIIDWLFEATDDVIHFWTDKTIESMCGADARPKTHVRTPKRERIDLNYIWFCLFVCLLFCFGINNGKVDSKVDLSTYDSEFYDVWIDDSIFTEELVNSFTQYTLFRDWIGFDIPIAYPLCRQLIASELFPNSVQNLFWLMNRDYSSGDHHRLHQY